MMSLPDRAKTLKEAFQVCDVGPLQGEALRYYVNLEKVRSMEAIQSVSTRLDFLEAGQFSSVLFTGHRGCGKSTELRRLQKQWEQDYRIIYLEADEELDINDADYTDLYLVLIKQVADDLARLRLKFDATLLARFESWFKEITEEDEQTVEKSLSIETTLEAGLEIPFISKLLAKLLAQIKGSNIQKRKIREVLQRDIGRLKTDINTLLKDAAEKLKQRSTSQYQKGFLVIFDNLDRVPPAVGDRLYFDYATQLQELNCTLIYTVPISVVYSDKNLNNAFSRPNIVPMVNLYQFDRAQPNLSYNKSVIQALAKVISHRIDLAAVFESMNLVAELVVASGGHMRQLMQMTATACLTAATRGHPKVQTADVAYAIKQEQFNFERVIPDHHYPLLVEVCKTKRILQNLDGQKMLFNTSVLEYNGDRRWNYINPVVKQSDAFKQAVANATQSPPAEI
jgi:energy-coupling factor transporter ATP-binding protein EcfA2